MSYSQYEFLKQLWIAKNSAATHVEYQQAMQLIARKRGV